MVAVAHVALVIIARTTIVVAQGGEIDASATQSMACPGGYSVGAGAGAGGSGSQDAAV